MIPKQQPQEKKPIDSFTKSKLSKLQDLDDNGFYEVVEVRRIEPYNQAILTPTGKALLRNRRKEEEIRMQLNAVYVHSSRFTGDSIS